MNVAAWEPVIKETHWFGAYEIYEGTTDVFYHDYGTDTDHKTDEYFDVSPTSSIWIQNHSNNSFYDMGYGLIGTYKVRTDKEAATINDTHKNTDYCFGIEARWNGSYANFTQQTKQDLPVGTYQLTFDVQNVNSATNADLEYDNKFYVEVNGEKIRDSKTEWMNNGGSDWTTHTIRFSLDSPTSVFVSLGFGIGSENSPHEITPALYVSNIKLEKVNSLPYTPTINWAGNYIESMTVLKVYTGQSPQQTAKTSYYSWLSHELRFSVDQTGDWEINNSDNGNYSGVGLKNKSGSSTNFYINNLKTDDQFKIEYYRYHSTGDMPRLVSGSVSELSTGNVVDGTLYYTMTGNGSVCISIPSNAVIRSVFIILKEYQKAGTKVERLSSAEETLYGGIGYRYSYTGAGVLEDKRGAVPYITMKFGAENDMSFVKNLGSSSMLGTSETVFPCYGVSNIIDESNEFDPSIAHLQYPYQGKTRDEMKKYFAGKEWSVFKADQQVNGDIFNTIWPLYGSFYYFFPEVNGKLIIDFYCEDIEETPAFWYKQRKDGSFPQGNEQPAITKMGVNEDKRTNNDPNNNLYRYIVDVEKGGIYYLCSLPTNIAHEYAITRLVSYAFVPSFRVEPFYKVENNNVKEVIGACEILGGPYTLELDGSVDTSAEGKFKMEDTTSPGDVKLVDFMINGEKAPLVKCLGNIVSCEPVIETRGERQYLDIKNIKYKYDGETEDGEDDHVNKGGAIVVHIECTAGEAAFVLTVAYDATDKNLDGTAVSTMVKKWDFYAGGEAADGYSLELGKYNGYSAIYPDAEWFSASKLYKETHKADGLTADWVDTYVNLTDNKNERVFKSVYDMEGDNADMIHETAGLIFMTHANQLVIYNENNAPTSSFQDRYVGLIKGGEFSIPLLEAGDRIVMKMGTYNNEQVSLTITGANDAVGSVINSDYIIGGSTPVTGDVVDANGNYVARGEYHFIAATNGDVTFEVKDGQLLKIYSIEIYRNANNNNVDIITENEFVGDKPEILYTDKDNNATQKFRVKLNYTGLGETQTMSNLNTPSQYDKSRTGKFKAQGATVPTFTFNNGQFESTAAIAHDMFGTFRTRIGVQTKDNAYITDYADGDLAVGYRETKVYPYTWDFTDLKKYVSSGIDGSGNEKNVNTITRDEQTVTLNELKVWDQFGLRVNSATSSGTLFVSGGQLYGDQTMFPETAGIGIGYTKSDAMHNKKLTITGTTSDESGALAVSSDDVWTFTVPSVKAGEAVYVHSTPGDNAAWPQYAIGDGEKQGLLFLGNNAFAMKMADDADAADVTLYFQGCEVNKIAVSDYSKTVNKNGWASESRADVIDPELTSYMTGKSFSTFLVTGVDDNVTHVTMTRIPEDKLMPAATEGSKNACLIHNNANERVDLFGENSGFHLFVPDMHDEGEGAAKSAIETSSSLLKAKLTAGKVEAFDGDYTNFIFSYRYYDLDEKGYTKGDDFYHEGTQSFYRVARDGAESSGNQGYLPLLTSKVPPSYWKDASRCIALMFDEESGQDATNVEAIHNVITDGNDVYYNMSGQKMNSKPTRHGLYIMNGKKMYVK